MKIEKENEELKEKLGSIMQDRERLREPTNSNVNLFYFFFARIFALK
jgi:hypothetical protein